MNPTTTKENPVQETKCPCCKTGTPATNQFSLCAPCYRDVSREMRRDRAAAGGRR